MRLNNELVLPQAWLLGVKIEPTEEDPRVTLAFRTSLTRDVAEAFGCSELIYAGNVPRSGVDKMSPEGDETDCQCHFEHSNLAFSAVATSIGHYVVKFEGTGPELSFQVKLTGYAETAAELASKAKNDPMEITLKPAQMPLELQEEEGQCIECNNGIALLDDGSGMHASGQPCRVFKHDAPAETSDNEPALASVITMGGSHQKGKKGSRKKQEPIIDAEPPEEDDFMKEMDLPGGVQ